MRALLLILMLAALVGMMVAQRRGRQGLGIPAAATALLALLVLFTSLRNPGQPDYVDRLEAFHRAVAYQLGNSIREQLPQTTKILVLQDRREQPTLQRYATQQSEGLQQALGETPCELVFLNMADLDAESTRPPEEGLERAVVQSSYDKLKVITDAHPDAKVLVSFVGYPAYVRVLLRRNPDYRAFVWDVGMEESINWDAEIGKGRVGARVRFKKQPNLQATVSRSTPLEEVFALRYTLDTAN